MTLLSVPAIKSRLAVIFPDGTPERGYLTRDIAAKTVFTALYAGAIEGSGIWIRPNQVCRMTDEQSVMLSDKERTAWLASSSKNGFKPNGTPWFADNSREPIRDETIKEGFIPVRAFIERQGLAVTSNLGKYCLESEFSLLFDADISEEEFFQRAEKWRGAHLTKLALARQALVASGALISEDAVCIVFPNGESRALSPGPSSLICKAVIEDFAPRFLRSPHVLWLSESGAKVVQRDESLALKLGIVIDPSKSLPDAILVDLGSEMDGSDFIVLFVEAVATDGPINQNRKSKLTQIAIDAGFKEENLCFMTAFLDRDCRAFKKSIPNIAWGSYIWFVSEPDKIISLRNGEEEKFSEIIKKAR